RLLARREFLTEAAKRGEATRYARSANWPPPASFFNSGPIGLAYYLQTWFRYYLQQWIERRMSELETREGVYSLEYGYEVAVRQFDSSNSSAIERNIPDASGDFRDANGRNWAADVS